MNYIGRMSIYQPGLETYNTMVQNLYEYNNVNNYSNKSSSIGSSNNENNNEENDPYNKFDPNLYPNANANANANSIPANWGREEHNAKNYTDPMRLYNAANEYEIDFADLLYWTDVFVNYPSSPAEKYLLKQYTSHGDNILNSWLLGTDTLHTYYVNIFDPNDPSYVRAKNYILDTRTFFCLYLLDVNPNSLTLGNYIDKTDKDFSKQIDSLLRLKNRRFIEWYTTQIYNPILLRALQASNLARFRESNEDIMAQFRTICASHPSLSKKKMYRVYRGVNKMFYQQDGNLHELTTFHSTSLSSKVALSFGQYLCEFILDPECEMSYIEQYTLHQNEFEVLLMPGNIYKYVGYKQEDDIHQFVVLPPETDAPRRTKRTKTQRRREQRKRAKAAGGDGAAAGGGGGGAPKTRRATKLTRRRMMYGGQVKPANMNANTNTANVTTNKALNKPIANTINMSNVPPFSDPEELKKPNSRWTFIGPSINLGPPSAKDKARIAELLALK